MKVLITGGRDYKNDREMNQVLDRFHAERKFTYLIHGDARGADRKAGKWAYSRGVQPVAMKALWDTDGDDAGTKRNARMVEFAQPDLCISFSGGRGTANCMRLAREVGIELIDVEDLAL